MRKHDLKDLAREVDISCSQGDHLRLQSLKARGLLGMLLISVCALVPKAQPRTDARILCVIANGVAHGARLARSLADAIPRDETPQFVRDTRFALFQTAKMYNGPGLAPRSVARLSTLGRLRKYVAVRRQLPSSLGRYTRSRVYNEYLFLAQTLRFLAAYHAVSPGTCLIITDFDRHGYSYPWVWAGRKRGVTVATLVHGAPQATTYLPVLADAALVWGEVQEAWFSANCPDVKIGVTGNPTFHFKPLVSRPVERLVLCHSCEDLDSIEIDRVRRIILDAQAHGSSATLRLHPSARGLPIGTGWDSIAEMCSIDEDERPLLEVLRDGDLLLAVTSTAAVEALAAGTPVVIAASAKRPLPPDIEALSYASRGFSFRSAAGKDLDPDYLNALANELTRIVSAAGVESVERIRQVIQHLLETPAPIAAEGR